MKTNSETGSRSLQNLRTMLMAASILVAGLPAVSQGAAFDLPTGTTWDCVMSGARNGLAYLNFTGDGTGGTFTGFEILVPKVKNNDSGRGGAGSDSRSGQVNTNSLGAVHIFGGHSISGADIGSWGFNIKGQVVGFFPETVSGTSTNSPGFTNAVSFTAKVVAGSRITMVCNTPNGKVTFQGRPAVPPPLDTFSGQWNGFKKQNGQSFFEIFQMSLAGGPNEGPNDYSVTGDGAGYSYTGVAIISRWNKIAFAMGITPGDTVRAVFGSFNPGKATGKTKGWDQASGDLINKAKFDVEKQPAP